jgi:homocysteine S-methyltransferase
LESLLLGAQALELKNVIVVAGDPFGPQESATAVNDYRATELIAAIVNLNAGLDYRGRSLRAATDFCIGATVDLGRGIEREAALAARKVEAGAHFLITQPMYDPLDVERFADSYVSVSDGLLSVPVFYGVGLMEPDGVSFANVPEWVNNDLQNGRSGVEIALEVWERLRSAGVEDCYLVPPIRRSGARDYGAAREFLEEAAQ